MSSPAQPEFYAGLLPVEPSAEPPPARPPDLEGDQFPYGPPSLRKRASRALSRFLITFCIGVSATLTWQSYGDAARDAIANSYSQLGWLAAQAGSVAQKAPNTMAPAVPSFDQQQLSAISLDLGAARQSIDRIATSIAASQDEIARNVDRIAANIGAGQEQMTRSIDRIAAGQEELAQNSHTIFARWSRFARRFANVFRSALVGGVGSTRAELGFFLGCGCSESSFRWAVE